jgi:hypothetical protein
MSRYIAKRNVCIKVKKNDKYYEMEGVYGVCNFPKLS